ncbi:helix-turn-helix domain-containing protein [Streptomyces caniscabiei]|uniref:TrmB family transcriptional regulator n=1 Tax=Streptomyces caniscabiei TaxID=2746961 RepID=UPI0029B18A56|nr:helix-turn-helix domain-containing protein [Streptomyces caniscabiei]MDX2775907.1 helix-turn-helix domain-containing protein [Streptomyces caniscabiei]
MNNSEALIKELTDINLSEDEARIYTVLLEKPNTHLQLARTTNINRTKVYRLIETLEKRGLVARRTDDRGTFLVASDPDVLEAQLAVEERDLKRRRKVLHQVIPELRTFYREAKNPFIINTYEGTEGLRQMQWHELKTKGELLVLGNSTIEDMVVDHGWAEQMRAWAAERGYRTRELYNEADKKPDFTTNREYLQLYEARRVSEDELPVATPMVIYNDTVAIYQFGDEKRVGVEIVNKAFAHTMKSIFEQYWKAAQVIDEVGSF